MNNTIGNRGEFAVALMLSRPIGNHIMFSALPLGAKAELLDFVVNLVDGKGEFGPFFMLQVKTSTKAKKNSPIPAKFTSSEVRKALQRKIPVYLVAVDATSDESEEVFFIAVDSRRTQGFSSVPRHFDLNNEKTLMNLYFEVEECFRSHSFEFRSKFTSDEHEGQKT